MVKRIVLGLTFAALSASTLLAAGQGPSSSGTSYICEHVPSAVLAAACQYLGFCCS
jgi:hypothetical protein